VRTDEILVGPFSHEPGDPATAVEWWRDPCIAFTTFGSWRIRSRRGHGDVTPATVLVSEAGAEHDCRHEGGVDDRMLCVVYRREIDPGPRLLVPHAAALHSVRRSLAAELRAADPDRDEVEALSLALLEAVREAPGGAVRPGPGKRSRALAGRLRAAADARYRDPDLDLAAEALAVGLSRTRFIHVFRDVVGVTPHRYVVELRTSHAARLLAGTSASVTEVCFDSGFGSMPSFHAAFRAAYGMAPSAYRAARAACPQPQPPPPAPPPAPPQPRPRLRHRSRNRCRSDVPDYAIDGALARTRPRRGRTFRVAAGHPRALPSPDAKFLAGLGGRDRVGRGGFGRLDRACRAGSRTGARQPADPGRPLHGAGRDRGPGRRLGA
jgi:AraC family transcriptional regulator